MHSESNFVLLENTFYPILNFNQMEFLGMGGSADFRVLSTRFRKQESMNSLWVTIQQMNVNILLRNILIV